MLLTLPAAHGGGGPQASSLCDRSLSYTPVISIEQASPKYSSGYYQNLNKIQIASLVKLQLKPALCRFACPMHRLLPPASASAASNPLGFSSSLKKQL